MNIISVGCQCHNAMVLRKLNFLKESLPFDSIGTDLGGIIKVLKKNVSLEDFLTIKPDSQFNILNFWMGHFLDAKLPRHLLESDNPVENNLHQMFERRFDRLFNYFYNRTNVLLYNNLTISDKDSYKDFERVDELLSLNENNTLLMILRKNTRLDSKNDRVSIEYSDFEKINNGEGKKSLDFIEKVCRQHIWMQQ